MTRQATYEQAATAGAWGFLTGQVASPWHSTNRWLDAAWRAGWQEAKSNQPR